MASLTSQSAISGGPPPSGAQPPGPGQPRHPVSQAQRSKEAEAAFIASLKSEGSKIDAELQRRAKDIHANAHNLDKQDKKVLDGTKQLSRESDALEKFLNKTESQIPKTDSFEDEIARLEAELDMIDETLDEVDHDQQGELSDEEHHEEYHQEYHQEVHQELHQELHQALHEELPSGHSESARTREASSQPAKKQV